MGDGFIIIGYRRPGQSEHFCEGRIVSPGFVSFGDGGVDIFK